MPLTAPAERAREDVAALSRALKAHIRAAGRQAKEVGVALGRSKGYLTAVFSGTRPLKMKDVLSVFPALREDPAPFFKRLYPLAGFDTAPWANQPLRLPNGEEFTFRDVIERGLERFPSPPPGVLLERAREMLRHAIAEAGWTQKDVSVALGKPESALGQALRGKSTDLWAWHLFGTLHVLDRPPARFFAELFWPRDPRFPASEVVSLLEHLLASLKDHPRFPPPESEET